MQKQGFNAMLPFQTKCLVNNAQHGKKSLITIDFSCLQLNLEGEWSSLALGLQRGSASLLLPKYKRLYESNNSYKMKSIFGVASANYLQLFRKVAVLTKFVFL